MKLKSFLLIITTFIFLSGCTSSKGVLIDEDKLEVKNNGLKNSIDDAKLEAIRNIKSQITLTQNTNYSKNGNAINGNKEIDPFLYLYKGLRND